MWRRSTFLFVLLSGGLPACGASTSRADVDAAESKARAAQAEARREHARLVQLETRLLEMEHRLASQPRACEATPAQPSASQPRTQPLRSEGDFLTEARTVAPGAQPPATKVAVAASPPSTTPASERQHLEQLLQGLREYGFDPQSGLSVERREALRVLLRRERQLDLMNPWGDH